jgi:glucan endo-1,3-alpha-glucosidase
MPPRTFRLALLLMVTCAALPLHGERPRLVFAHYMLANRDYAPNDASGEQDIAAYQREIQQAQSIGIDGFALNAGGWFKEPWYIRRASEMFEAAVRLHTGFHLFFSADMCCSNDAGDVEDMLRRFANNPRYAPVYFRDHGKFLLTTFAGSSRGPEFWRALRSDLESGTHPSLREAPCAENLCPLSPARSVPSSAPLEVAFVPSFFFGGELPQSADIVSGLAAYQGILDGAFYWGIAGVPGLGHRPDQLPSSQAYAAALHAAGKLYMAPICFQFYGANANRYYEYSGFSGMRALWMDAVHTTHPEWIEIITWNDFVEGTYISPIANPIYDGGSTSIVMPSHAGATRLLAYFIAWYKTGRQPSIDHDEIYWAYRTHLLPPDAKDLKLYGPLADVVYVTANLTKPAKLRVSFGTHSVTKDIAAGSNDIQIPITAGFAPRFELERGARHEAYANGSDIIRTDRSADLYYSTGYITDKRTPRQSTWTATQSREWLR